MVWIEILPNVHSLLFASVHSAQHGTPFFLHSVYHLPFYTKPFPTIPRVSFPSMIWNEYVNFFLGDLKYIIRHVPLFHLCLFFSAWLKFPAPLKLPDIHKKGTWLHAVHWLGLQLKKNPPNKLSSQVSIALFLPNSGISEKSRGCSINIWNSANLASLSRPRPAPQSLWGATVGQGALL